MDLFDQDSREYDVGPEYFAASLSSLPLDDHRPRIFDAFAAAASQPSTAYWASYSPFTEPTDAVADPIVPDQSLTSYAPISTSSYVAQSALPTPTLSATSSSLLHVVSPQGRVIFASQAVTDVLGYSPAEFVGKHLTEYVAAVDCDQLLRELNRAVTAADNSPSLDFFTRASRDKSSESARVSLTCRLVRKDGTPLLVQITGHASFSNSNSSYNSSSSSNLNLTSSYSTYASASYSPGADSNDDSSVDSMASDDYRQPTRRNSSFTSTSGGALGELKGFVLTARPFTTSSETAATNSSSNSLPLDSFLDHKIENLRVKQVLDSVRANKTQVQIPGNIPEDASSDFSMLSPFAVAAAPTMSSSSTIGQVHTRRHSAGAVLSSATSPSSISLSSTIAGDYVTSSLPPRSKSISTTDHKISKKKKVADENDYKCRQCGTSDSPEWRKGPAGPKTLCNACGLRWSKSVKRSKMSGASSVLLK
ncbi:uncharacterized protein V2V93DRAFT_404213 [Kockiozyma suomiensis]|uniref:uncharacterized protein n=1 Tax=Kockiozyma suomiensis TaxID=1337062 RepID=UPI0033433155